MCDEICESKRSYVLEVPDIDFIRPCGVILLCFIAAWTCVVVSVILVVCTVFPIYVSVCFVLANCLPKNMYVLFVIPVCV